MESGTKWYRTTALSTHLMGAWGFVPEKDQIYLGGTYDQGEDAYKKYGYKLQDTRLSFAVNKGSNKFERTAARCGKHKISSSGYKHGYKGFESPYVWETVLFHAN